MRKRHTGRTCASEEALENQDKAEELVEQAFDKAGIAEDEILSALNGISKDVVSAKIITNVSPEETSPSYLGKSLNQVVLGNYTDDITVLGTALQVVLGVAGLDLAADIRDLIYDFTHWEWSWQHILQTSIDLIGAIPVIGVLVQKIGGNSMDERLVLFERLKDLKDYWVDSSVKRVNGQGNLSPSECEEEYTVLKAMLKTEESKVAYEKVINNTIEGVIHSILVMLDGGDELTDKFNIDIINSDTKKSLKEDNALHEEFLGYLLDVEENE